MLAYLGAANGFTTMKLIVGSNEGPTTRRDAVAKSARVAVAGKNAAFALCAACCFWARSAAVRLSPVLLLCHKNFVEGLSLPHS